MRILPTKYQLFTGSDLRLDDCTLLSKTNDKGCTMPIDPVCGMDVEQDTKERATYQGETYFFCSHECKEEFQKSPQDYAGDEGLEKTGT